jgi:ATP-binding cassette, subfamily B, bacterial
MTAISAALRHPKHHSAATITSSLRLRALRLMWQTSRTLALSAALFLVAEALLPNLVPIAMGRVTGYIPGAVDHGLSSAEGDALIVALAIAGAIYAVSLMRGPAEDALSALSKARVGVALQRRLVEAVCAPSGIGHLEDPDVLNRLSSAQGELLSYQPADAPMTLISVLGDRLSGVLACVVLATFRWWIGLMLLVVWLVARLPLRAMVSSRSMGMIRRASEPLRRSWYMLGLAWRPYAAKEVRVFGLSRWIVGEHRREWLTGMAPTWDTLKRINWSVVRIGALVFAAYAVAIAVLAHAAYHDEIGLRTLSTMLIELPLTMQAGIISFSDFSLEMMLTALPDLDSLTEQLAPNNQPAHGGRDSTGLPQREISFKAVGFRYPRSTEDVLTDLDLTLYAGQSLAIVGVNGAGKSTLVSLLTRLHDPGRGRITVDGTPLTEFAPRAWQRQVAVVYQDFTRYPLPAEQNVALNLLGEPSDAAALTRALERASAQRVIDALPEHEWTILSAQYEGGVDVSGGQWQRIALARALYAVERGAKVLVLDEPTAQLDVRGEAAFYDRFLEITAGVTSVVISHRFATVLRADRIAVLEGGRIAELGTHQELLARGGTYATMYELQVAAFREGIK